MPKSTSVVLWTPYVSCTMPAHEYLLTQPLSLTSLPQFHVQVKSITPTFTPVRPPLLPLMLLHQMVQFWINLSTAYLMSLSSLTLLTLAVYDLVEQFSLVPKLPIPATPLSSTLPAAFQTIFPAQLPFCHCFVKTQKFHRRVLKYLLKIKAQQAARYLMCRDFHPTNTKDHIARVLVK